MRSRSLGLHGPQEMQQDQLRIRSGSVLVWLVPRGWSEPHRGDSPVYADKPIEHRSMKPAATGTNAPAGRSADATSAAMVVARQSRSIVTRIKFATSPERVWGGLMFYEQIEERPPLHLRLLLPLPIGTENSKSRVGDEVKCLYEGGHLLKRITRIDVGHHYGFDVVEQSLAIGGGLALSGGCYTLRELPSGNTEVAVTTRYASVRRPRWLWKPIEAAVCHMFHRHLLSAMRRKVEAA
jgi:hypothetical protein